MSQPADKAAEEEREFERAVAKEVRKDLDNDNRPAIERHFEDVLDEINTSQSSSTPVGGPNRKERDAAERGIREFCQALKKALTEVLKSERLKLRHVVSDAERGVVITAEDAMRNSWEVAFAWEGLERIQSLAKGNHLMVLDAVAAKCLMELRDARARWWAGRKPRAKPVGVA